MSKYQKYIFTIIITGLINLLLLYYLKYSNNSISLTELNIFKTGNLINLILTFFLCAGCILILITDNKIHIGHLKTLSALSIIYLIPLLIIIGFISLELEFKNEYLLGYPLKKIVPVLFYVINQLTFLFILFTIWYLYANNSLFAYLYSLVSVTILIIFFLVISFIYTYFIDEQISVRVSNKYEFGIVLGAAVWSDNKPSPIFRGRIEKGADLYLRKIINKIQLTGGNAPGEVSEAKAASNYLTEKYKIGHDDIFLEETTSTTNEQIRFVKNYAKRLDEDVNFIIISDDFHLKRVEEMVDFYEINAKVVSSEYKLNFQKSLYYRLRDSIGLILFWFFAI